MPSAARTIGPLLAGLNLRLSGPDFDRFEVRVLHPARTLVEKLFATNELATGLGADAGRPVKTREARHLYDIARLLAPGSPALDMLATPAFFATSSRTVTPDPAVVQRRPAHPDTLELGGLARVLTRR